MLGKYLTETPHPTDDEAEYGARTQSWANIAGNWLGNAAGSVAGGVGSAASAVGGLFDGI
jgi:hypothetical protein